MKRKRGAPRGSSSSSSFRPERTVGSDDVINAAISFSYNACTCLSSRRRSAITSVACRSRSSSSAVCVGSTVPKTSGFGVALPEVDAEPLFVAWSTAATCCVESCQASAKNAISQNGMRRMRQTLSAAVVRCSVEGATVCNQVRYRLRICGLSPSERTFQRDQLKANHKDPYLEI